MNRFSPIFEEMRKTQMNDWVGGTDPEVVGDASAAIIRELLPINSESRVLDFGCGIGRGMLSLLKNDPNPGEVVGLDIMPPVIAFCEEHIKPAFSNTKFELMDDANDHYDRFIGNEKRRSRAEIKHRYNSHFTDAYAFSVFTHIDRKDFQDLLHFVSELLVPGGRFLFTCFTLTQHSRFMIANGQSIFPFPNSVFVDEGKVFWGSKDDPLAFIAFDKALLEQMIWDAGLALTKVHYGCWMGGDIGAGLQDVLVATKPKALAKEEEVIFTPVVDRSTFQ